MCTSRFHIFIFASRFQLDMYSTTLFTYALQFTIVNEILESFPEIIGCICMTIFQCQLVQTEMT